MKHQKLSETFTNPLKNSSMENNTANKMNTEIEKILKEEISIIQSGYMNGNADLEGIGDAAQKITEFIQSLPSKDVEVKDIEFLKWYSGMDESKIRSAFERFKKENHITPTPSVSIGDVEKIAQEYSEKDNNFPYSDFQGKEKGVNDEHTGQALRGAYVGGFEDCAKWMRDNQIPSKISIGEIEKWEHLKDKVYSSLYDSNGHSGGGYNVMELFKSFAKSILASDAGWVSCEERLPNHNEQILFIIKNRSQMRKGVFLNRDQWERPNMFCDGAFFISTEVTHWMPLPKAPTVKPKK